MKVVFFVHSEWAFGSIHYGLSKQLVQHDIHSQVLGWENTYSLQEIQELESVADLWVTTPHGFNALLSYGVAPDKIAMVIHGVDDIHQFTKQPILVRDPSRIAVVSKFLQEKAGNLINLDLPVLTLGIDTNWFHLEPAKELKTVGFASKFNRSDPHHPEDLKRGELAEKCAADAGLEFLVAENYHNSFVTMPGFYNSVDCILVPSMEEGAGLPAMEAAAAGRLVISTPVGHWERMETGIQASIENFYGEALAYLEYYKHNPKQFEETCILDWISASRYDWKYNIQPWVRFLKGSL